VDYSIVLYRDRSKWRGLIIVICINPNYHTDMLGTGNKHNVTYL
jgi:hypothetical protein